MKVLAVSVVELALTGSRRGGTPVYIASLIEALQDISEVDVCLLAHEHSGLPEKNGKTRIFPTDPAPNILLRHWSSWQVGVKSSVWRYRSEALKAFLKQVEPGRYDAAIFLEENAALYGRYLPASMPKILVRHNLDSESIKIDTSSVSAFIRTKSAKHLSRRFDRWTLRQFSRVTIGTEPEKRLLQTLGAPSSVSLLPTITRFDVSRTPVKGNADPAVFKGVFIGDFAYTPNAEAVSWFINCQDHLPPELLSVLEIILIGRAAPEIPEDCKIRFRSLGFVDDLYEVLGQCQFGLIPIVSGSGVKVKALTLLASGLPVVTTPEGVSGISVQDGVECLIAKDHASFASAIARLFADPDLRERLQKNARDFMARNFSAQRQNEILKLILSEAIQSQ